MPESSPRPWRPWPVIVAVVASILAWWFLPAEGLSTEGRLVAAVAVLMGVLWMTEALPIEVTGLVPLAAFPLLGARTMSEAAAPYSDRIIFFFLGGMLLGAAMERWGLHRRFALAAIGLLGSRPSRLVGAFLFATAAVSMVVSNTAATVMMLPIGASVVGWVLAELEGDTSRPADLCRARLGPAVVLAIAYGASIGGTGTVIGTPPIAQFAGFMQRQGAEVSFFDWLKMGVPTLLVVLPITWFVLTQVVFRIPLKDVAGVKEHIHQQRTAIGRITRPELAVLIVFTAAACLWISSRWLKLDDATIAVAAAIALFIIPVRDAVATPGHAAPARRTILTWNEGRKVPWGILLLFGGGLSLADAIQATGVDAYIAAAADGLAGMNLLFILWIIAFTTIFLTEFTSNTALVAAGLPVALAVAGRLDAPPSAILVTMTLSACLAFMLPAGTAPNALVFASGHVSMRNMMAAGIWLNIACALAIPLLVILAMHAGFLPGTPR